MLARFSFSYFIFGLIIASSVDCPNVIEFARGLNMKSSAPELFSDIEIDCCEGYGVTCDKGRVIEIVWYSISLNGTMKGKYLPSSLVSLLLENNKITGKIPSKLPITLKYFDVSGNGITGPIPTELPLNLVYLDLGANKISDTIPKMLPNSLTTLSLWSNTINGTIPDPLPPNLIELILNGNKMSGDVPRLPKSLISINLGFPKQNGIIKPHFTGVIELYRPIDVRINNNYITDIIIQDTSHLKQCDLSQNPLLGNPNIALLKMCIMTGLYEANTLPKTASATPLNTVSATKISESQPTSLPDANEHYRSMNFNDAVIISIAAFLLVALGLMFRKRRQNYTEVQAFLYRERNESKDELVLK
eukprot:NODE_224_length_13912_cov_0.116604.p2 type:complete len:361 gc:universal NODE_224_length_13912_cov_0.116604:2247-3329(+)